MRRFKPAALLREAGVAALSSPVASLVTIVMIAGMCLAVLLTQGRTVGAQTGVIATLDDAGTRSIIARADSAAMLESSVVERIAPISSVEWVGGFSSAIDATNAAMPGGPPVAVRYSYGADVTDLGVPVAGIDGGAYVSALALETLGLDSASGALLDSAGVIYPIVDVIDVPEHLEFLEPLVIVPREIADSGLVTDLTFVEQPLAVLVVIAIDASMVNSLTNSVLGLLDVPDTTKVTFETSSQLATLRGLIDAQLAGSSHAITVAVLVVTAGLVAVILTGLVMMRRKDYGRRRALGASQGLIMGLIATQTTLLAAIGASLGAIVAFIVLAVSGDPLPPWRYFLAIAVLATATGMVASLLPAWAAARRDPVRELRTP